MRKLMVFILLLTCGTQLFAATYTKGTIDITPLMFGFGHFPFGFNTHDSKINGMVINTFKASNGFVVSDVEKMTRGYSGELGYFVCDNTELKARISYLEDKALSEQLAVYPRAYEFNSRNSWGFSLGANRYFNIQSEHWLPFVGIMGGVIFQKPTQAMIYNIDTNAKITAALGYATLQGAKRRAKASLNVGVDYRFSKRWAIGFTTGLSYLGHPEEVQSLIFGMPTRYEDNDKKLTIPFYVSIKNLIP